MHGFLPDIASQFEFITLDSKFPIAEAYIHNQPYWIETPEAYQTQFPEGYEKLKPISTAQALACLPLTINKQVKGCILIAFTSPQVMDEPFRDLTLTIAEYCSQALERAMAYNNAQSARAAAETAQQRIAFLSEASVVLSTSLDTQAILEHLAQMIVPRLADWCFITLEPGYQVIRAENQDPQRIEAIIESHPPEHRAESHLIIDIDQISDPSLPSMDLLHKIGAISYIHVPLSSRGYSRGMVGFATSQFHYSSADLQLAEELAGRVALAIENAQLYAAEHLLRQAAERTSSRIARLQEATASLLRSLSLTKVAEIALEQVAASLNASAGIIALCRAEALSLIHGVGYPTDQIDLWKTLNLNQYPDLADCTKPSQSQWIKEIPESFTQIPFVQAKHCALAVLPLTIEDKSLGVIVLCFEDEQEFTVEDQAFVTALIHNSVQALERALLYDEAQKVAILEERNRLARDLHDAVTQVLFSSSVLSEALLRKKDLDNEKTRLQLERLHRLNRGALAEMRSLLLELRPARLVETTIDELLEQLANAIMGRKDIVIEVNASKGCMLPPDVQIAYYRIAQEVLNNIVKHSEASQVALNFMHNGHGSELLIQDNGRGFDPQAVMSLDSGIGFMRERAKTIGADLTITSNNSGTLVRLRSTAVSQETTIKPEA
jgi:signal transduction histidine kinase